MNARYLLSQIWHSLNPIIGLPLLYIGVALLAIHFFTRSSSNMMMIAALLLELIGAAAHYWKIKRT